MYTIYRLTLANFKMFLRNKQAVFFTMVMPLFIMLIFGYIGFDKPVKIDVGLITDSPNAATMQFVETVKAFPTFTVHEEPLEEQQLQMDEGNRAVILVVPDDLVGSTDRKPITAYINAGKAGEAQAVLSILRQGIDTMSLASAGVKPIATIEQVDVNAHNLRYIEFLLPGLMALSIMQMSVFSVAFVFTQYKEKGVLKRLLATPMKPFHFVASNAITRLVISVVQAFIFILVGLVLFNAHVVGSYWLLILVVMLGALMFLGLGFTISGIAKTTESVPAIANIVVFPMMFLGGTFFAIANMPSWLQVIAKFLPLTFFSTPLREIMTKGSGLDVIWPDLLGMLIWGVILISLATMTFRFQEKDSA